MAVNFVPGAFGDVAFEFDKLSLRLLEILPRALGTKLETTGGIGCPAVMPLVEEVVRVGVVHGLNTIVAGAVEPARALESLGPAATHEVVGRGLEGHPGGNEDL